MAVETAFTFRCADAELPGILHTAADTASRGVLIVVGGPQYRVGSHRQFVLLARDLASAGIPVLRFDYRGMGDAGGKPVTFEDINDDIAAALNAFFEYCPGLREVVLWGLCDAASAALFYAWRDPRVTGLVLLNPWVRTEAGEAKAYLKHYYLTRLVSPDLWRKIGQGDFDFMGAGRSLWDMVAKVRGQADRLVDGTDADAPIVDVGKSLPERMAEGLERFTGSVLVILSGDDLTAAEFKDAVAASRTWRRLLGQSRVTRHDLLEANHTFSRREWRDRVAKWTLRWIDSW